MGYNHLDFSEDFKRSLDSNPYLPDGVDLRPSKEDVSINLDGLLANQNIFNSIILANPILLENALSANKEILDKVVSFLATKANTAEMDASMAQDKKEENEATDTVTEVSSSQPSTESGTAEGSASSDNLSDSSVSDASKKPVKEHEQVSSEVVNKLLTAYDFSSKYTHYDDTIRLKDEYIRTENTLKKYSQKLKEKFETSAELMEYLTEYIQTPRHFLTFTDMEYLMFLYQADQPWKLALYRGDEFNLYDVFTKHGAQITGFIRDL